MLGGYKNERSGYVWQCTCCVIDIKTLCTFSLNEIFGNLICLGLKWVK